MKVVSSDDQFKSQEEVDAAGPAIDIDIDSQVRQRFLSLTRGSCTMFVSNALETLLAFI